MGWVSVCVDGVCGLIFVNFGIGGNGWVDSEIVFIVGFGYSVFDIRVCDLYLIIGVWGEELGYCCYIGGCIDCIGECDRIVNNYIVIVVGNGDYWFVWKIKVIWKLGFMVFFLLLLMFFLYFGR